MSSVPALRTEGLGKRYRGIWALRECAVTLPAGKVIALVGPNGAGKTTLLRLAVGLIAPTVGAVEVFGRPAGLDTARELARVGFVAQDYPLYNRFSVADLLRFGQVCNLRFDRAMAQRRLARLGIDLRRRAGTLSGGERAQVSLTLALAKRPELLLLDEPLASLDPLGRREFLQTLMGVVADDGTTVVFSSHAVDELERVCDHLLVLDRGRVRLCGDLETLLAEHRLLIGPRTGDEVSRAPTVIETVHSDRHTTVLVRDGGLPTAPGWQGHPVALDELILAYLRRPVDPVSGSGPTDQGSP